MSHFCDLTSWVIPHFDKIIHSVWFEALKLHLPVLRIWAGSIYRSRLLTTGSQIVLFLFPTSQEIPPRESVGAAEMASGLCFRCVSPIFTLISSSKFLIGFPQASGAPSTVILTHGQVPSTECWDSSWPVLWEIGSVPSMALPLCPGPQSCCTWAQSHFWLINTAPSLILSLHLRDLQVAT